jgi:hypothetical protein
MREILFRGFHIDNNGTEKIKLNSPFWCPLVEAVEIKPLRFPMWEEAKILFEKGEDISLGKNGKIFPVIMKHIETYACGSTDDYITEFSLFDRTEDGYFAACVWIEKQRRKELEKLAGGEG